MLQSPEEMMLAGRAELAQMRGLLGDANFEKDSSIQLMAGPAMPLEIQIAFLLTLTAKGDWQS